MTKTDEIRTLEEQGFRFVGVNFKEGGTILIEMKKEDNPKPRNLPFFAGELLHEEYVELFSYIMRKICDIQGSLESRK